MKENTSIYTRNTVPADGQGLISTTYGAFLACSIRVISENELDILLDEMSKVTTIEEMLGNRSLMKIVNKIPKAFQVRHKHTGIKGMFIVFPLELLAETKNLDIIVTAGLSKYGNGSWGTEDIEVCAYLKHKNEWVNLNVQFVNALTNYDDPKFLVPIVEYWHNFAMSTLNNDIAKLKFHNIVSSFGDDGEDDALRLATALRTNINLKNERYMLQLADKQYKKFYENLMTGRLPVPGRYSYMVTDPMFMLNQLFGTNLPELKAGEYWMNGKQCKAGLFRSPLIAPFEAQRVQLVSHDFFDVFYKDITIFNGYDGIWEIMGGADFDGDTCACIPEDTDLGKIIVDAIQERNYIVIQNGAKKKFVEFNKETFWADMAKYNSTVARADRTGLITNYATKALELWHHLKNAMYYAKYHGAVGIYFAHPNELRKDESGNIINPGFQFYQYNGEKYLYLRGLVYATKDTEYKWVEMYHTGVTTFEEVEDIMTAMMLIVEYINPLQGIEIDGAKTGVYAELIAAIMLAFQSEQTSKRNEMVGKTVSKTAKLNSYISMSPLGIIFKDAEKKYAEFKDAQNGKASDKIDLLKNLLTNEETTQLNMSVNYQGTMMSLVDYIKERKSAYGTKIRKVRLDNTLTDEEKLDRYVAIRDGIDLIENGEVKHYKGEIENLLDLCSSLNISEEVIAVASYIATNYDNSESVRYGWLLFNELLSVFARENEQVTLYRVPAYTEEVSIQNDELFINGKKFAEVEAEDTAFVPVQNINGKLFALVKKAHNVPFTGKAVVGSIHEIKLIGFKYQNHTPVDFKADYHNAGEFTIDYIDGTPYAFVNGNPYAQVKGLTTNELIGHSVVTAKSPNYKETDASIVGLCVRVTR